MGLTRFELVTPRLSSVCSNQLSYRPLFLFARLRELETSRISHSNSKNQGLLVLSKLDRHAPKPSNSVSDRSFKYLSGTPAHKAPAYFLRCSRKEVIQPQVLLQLPCYDFTPITDHTLGTCPPCGLAKLLLVQPAFVM